MNYEKYTKEQIIEALQKSKGFITQAAKILGCTYNTVYNYREKYPEIDIAFKEQKEAMLDFAESKLLENINANDNTAIIFYLKTQGRNRGYGDRVEVSNPAFENMIRVSKVPESNLGLIKNDSV